MDRGTPPFLQTLWAQRQAVSRPIGTLALTSGSIIACDPLVYFDCAEPFSRAVPPGRYPVRVGLEQGAIRFALLVLSEQPPVRWEAALCPGEADAGPAPGFPVDSGVAAFLDGDAAAQLLVRAQLRATRQAELAEGDAAAQAELERELPRDPFIRVGIALGKGTAGALVLSRATGSNVVFFTPGAGEGSYASYWGLDAAGRPSALVANFAESAVAAAERPPEPGPPQVEPSLSPAEQRSALAAQDLVQLLVESQALALAEGAQAASLALQLGPALLTRQVEDRAARVMAVLLGHPAVEEVFLSDAQLLAVLDTW